MAVGLTLDLQRRCPLPDKEMPMEKSMTANPATLASRHADLEMRLAAEESRPHPDDYVIAELKKAKLQIKDALQRA